MALRLFTKENFFRVGKNVGAFGGGVVASKVGGRILRKASAGIDEFASKVNDDGSPTLNAGHVEAAGGVIVAGGTMLALNKVLKLNVWPAMPAVGAGIFISAYGGPLIDKAINFGFGLVDKLFGDGEDDADAGADDDADLPNGVDQTTQPEKGGGRGADIIDMPNLRGGGLMSQNQGSARRAAQLQRGGGLGAISKGRSRVGLGGELRRAGGLYSERGWGPRLGGEVRRAGGRGARW